MIGSFLSKMDGPLWDGLGKFHFVGMAAPNLLGMIGPLGNENE